jgi:hypothetical protein
VEVPGQRSHVADSVRTPAAAQAGDKEIETAFHKAIGNAKPTQEQLNAVVTDSLVPRGGQDPFATVNKKPNEYGLTACGSND